MNKQSFSSNNPNTVAPQAATPVAPQQPAPNVVQEPPTGGKNRILWIAVGVLILILILGGVFWYISSQQKAPSKTKQPTPQPAAQTNVDTLEKDLNSTSLDDLDKEFTSVDQDLKNL